MNSTDEKQLNRQRRERKFRRQLTTLSWTLPVFAFGSFFSIWHHISAAVNPPAHTDAVASTSANQSNTESMTTSTDQPAANTTPTVLYQIGSRSPQVRVIQEQLHELGYFNHQFTNYYGAVTARAIESFQAAEHLNETGTVDSATLTALQKAARDHQSSTLVSHHESTTTSERTTVAAPVKHTQTTAPTVRSVAPSQQSVPQTTSSGS